MWKAVLAGTMALAIAGSTLVYAQQRGGRPDGMQRGPNIEDMRAFAEARLAGLKAGLTLTPEQERNWPAFEQAARDMQKLRLDRMNSFMAERRDAQPRGFDPADRLRQRGNAMANTGVALQKLADATDPLYKSLDDSQKRRFAILGRMGAERDGHGGPQFRGRDGGGGPDFRGRDGGPRGFERGFRRTEMMPEGHMHGGHGPGHMTGGPVGAEDL
jgi:zinc resistance-associated protein